MAPGRKILDLAIRAGQATITQRWSVMIHGETVPKPIESGIEMKRRSLQAIAAELNKATQQATEANQRLLKLVDALGTEVTFRTSLAGLLEQYRQDLEAGKPRYGLRTILDHVESYFIQTAMRQAGQNIALAAERLRVPEATLRYKLSKHDLR